MKKITLKCKREELVKVKNIFLAQAVICIFTILITPQIFCQTIIKSVRLNIETKETNPLPDDNFLLSDNMAKEDLYMVNIKAVRKFVRDFKGTKKVTWCKAVDGGYVARFTNDSIQTMAAYNHRGSWSYTLKRYSEAKMPDDVRAIVKNAFPDYAITEVTEIASPQERESDIYRILIRHADNFKILNIYNWEMEIINDYTKP